MKKQMGQPRKSEKYKLTRKIQFLVKDSDYKKLEKRGNPNTVARYALLKWINKS